MDKRELRKYIRELKRTYTKEEKHDLSVPLWKKLEENEHFKKARVVLGYWSMDDEVDTHDFIVKWAKEKIILLPCVRGDELELRRFDSVGTLRAGEAFGIPEPVGELYDGQIDVALVPGVAFDARGNRLGRGKGYYDRILKDCSAYKIGICFNFQFVEQVPVDENDIRMEEVIR